MRRAVDYIMDHYEKVGQFAAPSLSQLDLLMAAFYYDVLHLGLNLAKTDPAVGRKGTNSSVDKKLAASDWPTGIPKHLTGLEKIFRNKRYWPSIMKRSEKITDRVRKQYLKKLQQKFNKILPSLHAGEITPSEARSALMKTWDASKPRVELIFRTETSTYFGKTQTAYFDGDDDIIGFLFDSVKDIARTDICRTRHGLIYRPGTKLLRDNTPSLHYNCRSHLIPLANTEANRKLLAEASRDPSKRSVAPLLPGWRK